MNIAQDGFWRMRASGRFQLVQETPQDGIYMSNIYGDMLNHLIIGTSRHMNLIKVVVQKYTNHLLSTFVILCLCFLSAEISLANSILISSVIRTAPRICFLPSLA